MIRPPAVALLLLTACGGGGELPPPIAAAGQTGPVAGGTLHISINDDVRTLDPAIAYDEYSYIAERLCFDSLLGYEAAATGDPLKLEPLLAESWTISPDNLVYTFTLRPGLRYHDGSPMVADDFVHAIERVLTPATGSPGATFFSGIVGAKAVMDGTATQVSGLRALDDRTLEARLEQVDPTFLMEIALPFAIPVPRRWSAQQGERMRDTPLCSGPFSVASWREGSQLVYQRNPHYWDAAHVYLDRVVVDLQVDRDTGTLRFLRGELDSMERLPSDKLLMFARSPAWKPHLHIYTTMSSYGELMDVKKPPFDDKKVRQAMNYAINKQDTVVLYNGRATIAHGVLPPGLPGRDDSLEPYPYDPAKARALLAEAGYPDGFDVVYSTTPDEIAEKVAQSIQSDLAQVGVRVRIQLLTFPAYLTAAGRRDLQFAYTAWIMDFPDPWNFMELKFHSRAVTDVNASNESGFENAEFDALLDAARREPDHEKRMAMYRRAEHILYDECPWVWHYHPRTTEVVQPYVKNYVWHPVYTRDYRHAWLDKVRP